MISCDAGGRSPSWLKGGRVYEGLIVELIVGQVVGEDGCPKLVFLDERPFIVWGQMEAALLCQSRERELVGLWHHVEAKKGGSTELEERTGQ